MPTNNYYTIKNLLHYLYHQNYNKIIEMVLSRQTNTCTPQ